MTGCGGCSKSDEHKAGYAWLLSPLTYKLIEEYKKCTDYVILFLHAGLEDVEIPLAEWREQYKSFIDYGADLIVAGHPHIIQGKERYKDKFIFYSLGNFFFNGEYSSSSPDWTNSLVLECDIYKSGIKTIEHFVSFNNDGISYGQSSGESSFKLRSDILLPQNVNEYMSALYRTVFTAWEDYYRNYYSFPIWKKKGMVNIFKKWFNEKLRLALFPASCIRKSNLSQYKYRYT